MRKLHLERGSDLLRALIVIQEESSEKEKQEKMARRLKGSRIDEEDEEADKEKAGDEGGDEASGGDEGGDEADAESGGEEKKPKKKDGKLPGAKRLEDAELQPGQAPTTKDIAQRINFIRAGASLKDDKVKRDIATWIAQLKEPERLAVFTTLDALAQIVLGRKSAAEAPTFSSPGNLEIKGGEDETPETSTPSPKKAPPAPAKLSSAGPVPITVGEGVVRKLKEIDVPVRSGRVVAFGSRAHVADLEGRIEDLERIRSYQEVGSDSRHALGQAIKALKVQLKAAMKRSSVNNPRTEPVPPIVEKEK